MSLSPDDAAFARDHAVIYVMADGMEGQARDYAAWFEAKYFLSAETLNDLPDHRDAYTWYQNERRRGMS